uniref:TrmH family RNA methyltransferase n=1 Tax=Mycolicibacterium sp. TaxID=2320850 RepID=UPI0028A6E0A8
GDVLMFGPEPTGLDEATLADPRITGQVRIPMLAGRRSLNLSNAAAVAAYEAWRQHGYAGGR